MTIKQPKWFASRSIVILAAVAVFTATLAAPARAEQPPAVAPSTGTDELNWVPCYEDFSVETGATYECAEAAVPLDYDHPQGRSISIALTRIPATDAEHRIGSLLLNPGGPGGSGVDFLIGFGPYAGQALGEDVPARFDLVGFDPRGISRSTPIRCFDTIDQATAFLPKVSFPLTRAEEWAFHRSDAALAINCLSDREARQLGPHLSTANVARDMDRIRAALGDEQLNFLGLSYGTFLGTTYANLFPDRVRSVVVDGVLDPVAWVNEAGVVPFTTSLRSDEGAAETLTEFFAQCEEAAPGNCALAPGAEQRFADVANALQEAPVVVFDPSFGEEYEMTYQDLISLALSFLYDPFGYADLAWIVASIEQAIEAPLGIDGRPVVVDAELHRRLAREQYDNFVEGFPAVACADTNSPSSYRTWSRAGAAADAEYGYFGRMWTWVGSPCAVWPFSDDDRYVGPFDAVTANPVLVIGNLYDPATRYEGAQTVHSLLPNSGLLTVDTPGHTSLGLNSCAGRITGQYLLDPAVAYEVGGFTCPPEFNVFDVVAIPPDPIDTTSEGANPAPEGDVAALIEVRRAVMDEINFVPRR